MASKPVIFCFNLTDQLLNPDLMHGSILPVTIPPGIPPGICNLFLTWQSIPHSRDSSSTTNTFCVQNINDDIDFRTIEKPDVLTRTYTNAFREFIERRTLHALEKGKEN